MPANASTMTLRRRRDAARFFNSQAETIAGIRRQIEDPPRILAGKAPLEKARDGLMRVVEKEVQRAKQFNSWNSSEPPFNIYSGNLDLVVHGAGKGVGYAVDCLDRWQRCLRTGRYERLRIAVSKRHGHVLAHLRYEERVYRAFAKIASGKFKPRKLDVGNVLQQVLEDRKALAHDWSKELSNQYRGLRPEGGLSPLAEEYTAQLEGVKKIKSNLVLDEDALYWMLMRFLSNAEHASMANGTANVRLTHRETPTHHEFRVEDAGIGIKARAESVAAREGGKSVPVIEYICRALGAQFELQPLEQGTASILRIPKKPKPHWTSLLKPKIAEKLRLAFAD